MTAQCTLIKNSLLWAHIESSLNAFISIQYTQCCWILLPTTYLPFYFTIKTIKTCFNRLLLFVSIHSTVKCWTFIPTIFVNSPNIPFHWFCNSIKRTHIVLTVPGFQIFFEHRDSDIFTSGSTLIDHYRSYVLIPLKPLWNIELIFRINSTGM